MTLATQGIAAIILAAGRGTRMGQAAPNKLLLPWRDGKPIVWHAVRNALHLEPLEVIVVVRPDMPELTEALSDLAVRCVPNPRYAEGMGLSLAVGIGALEESVDGALILLGDEPDLSANIVAELVAAYKKEGKPITVPRYGTQIGPPAFFTRPMFPALMDLTGDAGARYLIAQDPDLATIVPFEEQDRPRDIDTPDDYVTSNA